MRPIHAFALVAFIAAVPLANPGCNKYGEGEPCDVLNNNPDGTSNDCEDGLLCVPKQDLQNCNDSDICCPPSGATSPACVPGALCLNNGGGGAGGGMGTNVGGFGTGGTAGAGGAGTCGHDPCDEGARLDPDLCGACVREICVDGNMSVDSPQLPDPTCCTHIWDATCVAHVQDICQENTCGGTGGSTASGGGSTATTTTTVTP